MTAYAGNVLELPHLRFRKHVYGDTRDAVQRLVALIGDREIHSDAVVYLDGTERCLACGLANHLDLPCLLFGGAIRELVEGRDILLVVESIDDLDRLGEAVDWLMTFKVRHLVLAAPTGHRHAIDPLAGIVDTIVCPNIRCSWEFSAKDAFALIPESSGDEKLSAQAVSA